MITIGYGAQQLDLLIINNGLGSEYCSTVVSGHNMRREVYVESSIPIPLYTLYRLPSCTHSCMLSTA